MDIKRYISLYFILSISIIFIINIFIDHNKGISDIPELSFLDVFYIAMNNIFFTIFAYILSLFGLSFIFIFKIIFLIGYGPSIAGINPVIYYFSSISHGLLELLVGCLLFCFSVQFSKIIIDYTKGYVMVETIKYFLIRTVKYTIPFVCLVIFMGALFEVYISNKLIKFILSIGG
ncbi:hypothetical protein QJS65_19705 [Bacillus altitudinis]|uniref:hypothetical protein n=1 Tax=Bacillus TaxID=1386 RepID=UPI00247D6A0A|nr:MULTISPECIES: hypothetical protein [Bacillus]MDH6599086.1 magnesium-transporting ATPase (P-type) [Bacillus aerius]WHF26998.1 hypothetical protein QJS65_19705 [Bacillus altitudinis]